MILRNMRLRLPKFCW